MAGALTKTAKGGDGYYSNVPAALRDAINRGLIGGTLGAPSDITNMLINLAKAGYGTVGHATGLLSADQMPTLNDNPPLGSEHIGQMMQDAGIVSPNRSHAAELLAGFMDPVSATTAAAHLPAIALAGAVKKSGKAADALKAIPEITGGAAANVSPKVSAITTPLDAPGGVEAFIKKYGRKPIHTMTEQERVAQFGPAMAESPEVKLSDLRSRKELTIPGGLELDAPPMTLADQAKISAQGIDYNKLAPDLALAIHKRLVQSVDPGANPSKLELMNRLGFGITSGNAPITKNLIEWAQLRPRSEAEMAEWARYSPVGLNEQIPDGGANVLNRAINQAYGVQAGERGGTGVANTANRQYVSDLATMLDKNEGWFRRGVDEPESQYVERLMNQVRGLGPKTGSLGFAMVEPQTSNISAIDRHIADLTREAVSSNPATRDVYQQQMLNAFNLDQNARNQRKTYDAARRLAGEDADAIEAQKFRDVVSSPTSTKYIDAKTGDVRESVPEHLRDLPFYQPDQATTIGPMYEAALQQIKAGGEPRGIGGFSNQWHDWDFQRSRAEPHAALNPMATEMERLTPEEYKQVRDTFSQAGAMRTAKEPDTGRLRGLSETPDFRRLIYGRSDPELLAAIAALSGAGIVGSTLLDGDK